MEQYIYLDHNATTPAFSHVINKVITILGKPYNASSVHGFGRKAKAYLEDARRSIGQSLQAPNATIIFTATGTEANNLVLKGSTNFTKKIVSSIEHPSLTSLDVECDHIPVKSNGIVDINALEKILASVDAPALVSVMYANNETGVIQPIKDIVTLTHAYGGVVHTDASQALGKVPISIADLGIDMMTISSHKCGGISGAAALIISPCITLKGMIQGGGQELGFRAGTENIAAIIGLAEAVDSLHLSLDEMPRLEKLRLYLESTLKAIAPNIIIYGEDVARLPNTSYFTMPSVSNNTQLIHFDMDGIMVSSGSACSSGRVASSHVLEAMGVEEPFSSQAIRVSMGRNTSKNEINDFITSWKTLYERTSNKNNMKQEAA